MIPEWWGDGTVVEELDVRVGGRYRFRTAFGVVEGEFREVEAPERLVQTFQNRSEARSRSIETVSAEEVDDYLSGLEEPKRSTLEALRRTILEIVPEGEQIISYRVPAFRVSGKTIAGFAAFRFHLSYLPFSGSVLLQLADDLEGYTMTKSALHFPVDRPLPKALVARLIALRLAEAARGSRERHGA